MSLSINLRLKLSEEYLDLNVSMKEKDNAIKINNNLIVSKNIVWMKCCIRGKSE
jgi:hypothetical protein